MAAIKFELPKKCNFKSELIYQALASKVLLEVFLGFNANSPSILLTAKWSSLCMASTLN